MEVKNLSFSYDKKGKKILDSVSFQIPSGKVTTFMGANGSGKSTLFQLMTKNLVPDKGKILYQTRNIQNIRQKEFARLAAIVHQNNTAVSDITVERLISYGRTPHLSVLGTLRKEDHEIVEWAMQVMEIEEYRNRNVMDLSGGQRQRVWIAMALAQRTKLLFLDEPTTYLDIRYQIELLERIQMLNREYGITVIMVLHDINHAVYYSDYIIGLRNGKVEISGEPEKVISTESIQALYGIELEVLDWQGKKVVWPVKGLEGQKNQEEA